MKTIFFSLLILCLSSCAAYMSFDLPSRFGPVDPYFVGEFND